MSAAPPSPAPGPAPGRPAATLRLSTGHALTAVEGPAGPRVELIGPDGAVELTLRIGPGGAEVQLRAARLDLIADGDLSLRAGGALQIAATRPMRLEAGAELDLEAPAHPPELTLEPPSATPPRASPIRSYRTRRTATRPSTRPPRAPRRCRTPRCRWRSPSTA